MLEMRKTGLYLICTAIIAVGVWNHFFEVRTTKQIPQAVHGVIDLVEWDRAGGGTIKLDGEWEFYQGELLEPSDFLEGKKPVANNYFSVPNKWNDYQHKSNQTGDGYGTYRLHVKLKEAGHYLTIQIPDVATAYTLYIDGQLLSAVGTVGQEPATSKPRYLPQIVSFHTDRQEIELVIQVSNFAHQKGGLKSSLWLGLGQAGHKLKEKKMGFELFILGIFFIMSVYHFGLYLLRRKDKPAFYFGLFCLLIAIRTMATGEILLMSMFPNLDWEMLLKIEYLSYYLSVPIFVEFIYHLYASGTSAKTKNAIKVASIVFGGLVVFTPVKFFAKTLLWYDIITLFACIYIGMILIRALRDKQEGASRFILGVFIFLGTVINDMFFAQELLLTCEMVPVGLFIFIFFQALALSTKSSRAYDKLEKASIRLREYTEMLKEQVRLLDLDPDYTFEWTLDGTIVFWNHGAEIGYQWTKEEALGKKASALLKTQFPQPLSEINDELMGNGRWMGEVIQRRQDGSTVVVRSCWLLKRGVDGKPSGVLEFNKDITEQKNIEKEMARLDRLNLIGEMAASISHEVRNPMTTVRGFLQLLSKKEANEKYGEYYKLMLSELDRANDILTEHLLVSRPRESNFKIQSINEIFISLEPLLQADASKTGKELQLELGNVPTLMLDDGEIRQLILNLFRNGLEAMSHCGNIIKIATFTEEQEVILSISDEGSGIPEEMMEKLGTPFLSTKDKGTGLGLAVCYGIAARHRASIEVSSTLGGTTFFIKFKQEQP